MGKIEDRIVIGWDASELNFGQEGEERIYWPSSVIVINRLEWGGGLRRGCLYRSIVVATNAFAVENARRTWPFRMCMPCCEDTRRIRTVERVHFWVNGIAATSA